MRRPASGDAVNAAICDSCVEPAHQRERKHDHHHRGLGQASRSSSRATSRCRRSCADIHPASARKTLACRAAPPSRSDRRPAEHAGRARRSAPSPPPSRSSANFRYGAARNSHDAFSASTDSLPRSSQVAIGLQHRAPAPAHQPRLDLAHDADEPAARSAARRTIWAAWTELQEFAGISSPPRESTDQRREHQHEIAPDGEELQRLRRAASRDGPVDAALEHSPRRGRPSRPRSAPAQVSPGGGMSTVSRARKGAAVYPANRLGEAADACIGWPGTDREIRNPMPAPAASRARRSSEDERRAGSLEAMTRKTMTGAL